MSAITLKKLYANYAVLLDAKEKIAEHSEEYEESMLGVKGEEKEKKLSSQIIAKFFKHFPALQSQAVDALFDICEDDNPNVRKQGIKDLPSLCSQSKSHTAQVADILAQLLQLEDPQEHSIATNSFLSVIKEDAVQALKGLFKQIHARDDEVREKCIKFLVTKVKALGKEVITKDVEDFIIAEIKKLLPETSGQEFQSLMQYLANTKMGSSITGRQELVNFAIEQAELDADFNILDEDNCVVDRLIICINLVLPYFSAQLDCSKFVCYICDQVLPQWELIGKLEQGEAHQIMLLQLLAEMCGKCGTIENPNKYIQKIYDKLTDFMPPPPEDTEITEFPKLDFSTVECLIYAFHRLGRQSPEFLTENPALLKDFRQRLQYFARGVQGCLKTLREADVKGVDAQKQKAIRTIANINSLIKDLFYTPPKYQSVVTLSWKTESTPKQRPVETTKTTPSAPAKRHVPITFDDGPNVKQNRRSSDHMKLYVPPSGKFSSTFPDRNDRRPMGRGRGRGMRGRGYNRTRHFNKM